jgi:hypothetical protein
LLVHLEPPLALDVAEISAAAVADAAPDKLVINILHCLIPRQMFKNFEQIQFREKDTRAFVTSPCWIFFFLQIFWSASPQLCVSIIREITFFKNFRKRVTNVAPIKQNETFCVLTMKKSLLKSRKKSAKNVLP